MNKIRLQMLTVLLVGTLQFNTLKSRISTNNPDYDSSTYVRKAYNNLVQLVMLNKQDPSIGTQQKSMYESAFAHSANHAEPIKQLFNTSSQPYAELLLGTYEPLNQIKPVSGSKATSIKDFFDALCYPETLIMIAYMQNKYGNGEPFQYNSSLFIPNSGITRDSINPVIWELGGNMTSYKLLNNLIDAIDTTSNKVKNDPAARDLFLNRLNLLNQGLDRAIQQQASITFDTITNNLRNMVKSGNTHIVQDLVTIENKYSK